MISEGSCDAEDWSNDAANSAFQVNEGQYLLCALVEKLIGTENPLKERSLQELDV